MRISSKSHYAIRAMIELAKEHSRGNLQLKVISRRQDLSKKYLEQIFIMLRAKGLVDSQRGYSGGFTLTRAPREITVYEILKALENTMSPVDCLDHPETCLRHSYCAVRKVWAKVEGSVKDELNSITLASLTEEQIKKDRSAGRGYTYQI